MEVSSGGGIPPDPNVNPIDFNVTEEINEHESVDEILKEITAKGIGCQNIMEMDELIARFNRASEAKAESNYERDSLKDPDEHDVVDDNKHAIHGIKNAENTKEMEVEAENDANKGEDSEDDEDKPEITPGGKKGITKKKTQKVTNGIKASTQLTPDEVNEFNNRRVPATYAEKVKEKSEE